MITTPATTRIGLWLHDQIAQGAGDRVYLEPIGYIGYFSGAQESSTGPASSPPRSCALQQEKASLTFTRSRKPLKPDWIDAARQEDELMQQQKRLLP